MGRGGYWLEVRENHPPFLLKMEGGGEKWVEFWSALLLLSRLRLGHVKNTLGLRDYGFIPGLNNILASWS